MKKALLQTITLFFILCAVPMTVAAGGATGGGDDAGTEGPANPVHHCNTEDGTQDTTDWSYVYFGSYPQSEVTDSDTITAIESAISEKGLTNSISENDSTGSGEGTDVWVNGIKYRRISKSDTNNDRYFGEGSRNGYRYFKWERIKWRVLQNKESDLFVVADKALDCKSYNDIETEITWEDCTLRSWLNDSFYNTAFSEREQGAIVSQTVVNEDNPYHNAEGGNDTNDKVYLLSIGEITNPEYGFCSADSKNATPASRCMKTSDFAHARGIQKYTSIYAGDCWWYLRSPGNVLTFAAAVYYTGELYTSGGIVNAKVDGVCPVLHINLSSDFWSMEDDGTSGDGGEEKSLIHLEAEKTKTAYLQGEELNVDDLQVRAYYTHPAYGNSEELLTEGYTTNAAELDKNIPGNKTLRISYTEKGITKTAELPIMVKKPYPDSMPGETMSVANNVKTTSGIVLPEGWSLDEQDKDKMISAGGSAAVTIHYTAPDRGIYNVTCAGITVSRAACEEGSTILYTGEGERAPDCTTAGTGHTECKLCGDVVRQNIAVPAAGHTAGNPVVAKAGHAKNGSAISYCTVCNTAVKEEIIYAIESFSLAEASAVYDGKTKKPAVTVKDSEGNLLKQDTDYILSYPEDMQNVGVYTVKLSFQGNYDGEEELAYNIVPKGTAISRLKAKRKGFTLKWKKQGSQTTGYEIQYSANKKFTKKTTKLVRIKKNTTVSKTISKQKAKKKFYVRIRTYKNVKVKGKTVKLTSGWSMAKTVKTV